MEARTVRPLSVRAITVGGLALLGVYIAILFALMRSTGYDLWGGLVAGPILVIATVPMLRRQAQRERDPRLFWLLLSALLLKLAGSLARYVQVFALYEKGDARSYHETGLEVAQRFLAGDLDPGLGALSEEDVIGLVTGIVYTIFRPSVLAGFLVFSWLAFLGLFWFYRGFTIAVPGGRARSYAHLVFFLPSILFWPSSLGKEAWMLFGLGLASYGAALLLTGRSRGILPAVVGLLAAGWVRPHFAGIAGLALAIAFVVKRGSPALRQLAPVVKLGLIAALMGAAVLLLPLVEGFFTQKGFNVGGGLDTAGGIADVLDQTTAATSSGGSEFTTSGIGTPIGALRSAGTVLFRPLVIEAGNAQAVLTAIESTFLFAWTIFRWRWIVAAVKSIRDQPYVAYAGAFTIGSIAALSSIANFGILARERVLLLPAYVVLLSIPPRDPHRPSTRDPAAIRAHAHA